MAHYAELTNANGLSVNLADSTAYGIGAGSGLGAPDIENIWKPAGAHSMTQLVAYKIGNRAADLQVNVKGSSKDNWAVNYRAIARILREAKEGIATWLSVQFDGETYATVFDVLGGEVPNAPYFSPEYRVSHTVPYVPITLHLRPWGRKQQLTRNTGTITNGGGTANSGATITVTPDSERPATMLLKLALSAQNTTMIAAIRTKGNPANWLPVLHCETGSHTGHTTTNIVSAPYTAANAAVAAAQNGNVYRLTLPASGQTSRAIRIVIDKNISDWYGRFRAFLRVDSASAALTDFDVRLYYTGTDGIEVTNALYDGTNVTTDSLIDMGFVEFVQPPEGAVVTSLKLEILVATNAVAIRTVDIDCVYLVPWDEWAMEVEFSAALGVNDIVLLDNLSGTPGIAVVDSTGVLQPEYVSAPRLVPIPRLMWLPQEANRLIVLTFVSPKSGVVYSVHTLTHTIAVTADHYDLYDLIRGAVA